MRTSGLSVGCGNDASRGQRLRLTLMPIAATAANRSKSIVKNGVAGIAARFAAAQASPDGAGQRLTRRRGAS